MTTSAAKFGVRPGLLTRTHLSRTGVAAVVAPYGSGAYYQEEFLLRRWSCVAVTLPNHVLPSLYRGALNGQHYDQVVVHDGSLRRTARMLRTLGVSAVVAGTEIGVPLTDQLSQHLGLPGNDPATTDRRRDKGAMAAALAEAGVPGPRSFHTDRVEDAVKWAKFIGVSDYVLKPADSAGSDGVHFCAGPDEIRSAWRALHRTPNAMGGSNQSLVLQERLQGWQYVVNSVSTRGSDGSPQHQVTEVWSDTRIGAHLYDRTDLLNRRAPLPRVLGLYTQRVLDALGIVEGPAHSELMYVPGRGPVLIESGARPEGSYDPEAMRHATGSDHIRDAVHTVVTGQPKSLGTVPPKRRVTKVSLRSPLVGTLDEHVLGRILALPTVKGSVGNLVPGASVRPTTDLLTSPGRLVLVADDERAIAQDYHSIRAAESSGLYVAHHL